MTLDETINRLELLREELGGDTPFCIKNEQKALGSLIFFEPAAIEVTNVICSGQGEKAEWTCLPDYNTEKIVSVY